MRARLCACDYSARLCMLIDDVGVDTQLYRKCLASAKLRSKYAEKLTLRYQNGKWFAAADESGGTGSSGSSLQRAIASRAVAIVSPPHDAARPEATPPAPQEEQPQQQEEEVGANEQQQEQDMVVVPMGGAATPEELESVQALLEVRNLCAPPSRGTGGW
jgi:hypothetical protein